jgi:predicted nucleotidyltransferase component of viral defense system
MTDKIEFFGLSVPEQQLVIQQTAERLSLPVQAVEKDLWVSCFLQILFDSPLGNVLVFKGGTSLSKIWRLIDRFSEDIDLAIDRRHFGLDGDLTKRQLKSLRKKSSLFDMNPYIHSQVLLEVGARSLMEPASFKKVHSFVNETFPKFVLPLDV